MEIEFNGFRIILIELASFLNVRRYLTFMQKSFFCTLTQNIKTVYLDQVSLFVRMLPQLVPTFLEM